MDVVIEDNPERSRYEIHVDGELAGVADYVLEPGTISHVHTEVASAFARRGLASRLVRHALVDARGRDLAVLPYCSFVAHVIASSDEFLDLVPASRRAQFGL